MITEDYVSFEIAKLLKEKGFDELCNNRYYETHSGFDLGLDPGYTNSHWEDWYKDMGVRNYSAPTLQMAVKWLRDVHNLIISVEFTVHGWLCDITKIVRDSNGFIVNINHGVGDDALPYCDEYEKSCETAIKYCLENLI